MYEKSIRYDRETRDYAMYLDGELVGFARTYHECEITLDALVSELLSSANGIAQSDADRFWEKVEKADACWNWTASTNGVYGQFYFNNDGISAHRFSYILFNGAIPEGAIVRHTCDNPLCVNPSHLEVGTNADNTADMMERGRGAYIAHPGESNGRAKLSADQVNEIRASYSGKYGEAAELARKYGVTKTTMSRVLRGKLWKEEPISTPLDPDFAPVGPEVE